MKALKITARVISTIYGALLLIIMIGEIASPHAENGDDALTMVKDHNYSVIISDVGMPGMDGIEFHQTLKVKRPATAQTIVFVSGSLEESELSYLKKEGCPYLAKPFANEDLINLVKSIIQSNKTVVN